MPKRGGKGPIKTIARGMGKANNALGQITAVLDQQSQALQQIQASGQNDSASNQSDAKVLMSIKIQQAQLELQKDQAAFLKKIADGQSKQIEALQKGNKDWKTVGDKFKDMKRNLQDALDPNTIKKAMLGPFSMFKGVRDKQADYDYVKRMKALGSGKSDKDLMADSKAQRGANRDALRAQSDIDRLKKMGASDDQIKSSDAMKKRNAALATSNSYNQVSDGKSARDAANPMGGNVAAKSAPLPKTPSDKGQVAQSTTDMLAEQQVAHENQAEMLRLTGMQADLLQQIASNTAIMAGTSGSSAGGKEDSGKSAKPQSTMSKVASGISDTMGALGSGVAAIGKGIGDGIGAIFKGILGGLSDGIKMFASAKTVAGIAVMGLLTAVVWGLSKALENFANLDWDTLAKAGITIAALIGAGALAGSIAPMLGLGALALAGLGASVWVIGQAMDAMGEGLKNFTDGMERLAAIDGGNLLSVAAGVAALGAAIAAFGAGQAVAGLGTLVGNLLTIGQDSPVEQLIKIGTVGPGVKDAADGLGAMSGAMKEFAKVDSNSMKAVKDFPWEQATKFAAAGGAMSVAGASVYNASKGNADEQAKVDGKKGGGAIVNAPTTVSNNNQTNVIKPAVRNQESSYNKYLTKRFA
jgi:hypothetical protein